MINGNFFATDLTPL